MRLPVGSRIRTYLAITLAITLLLAGTSLPAWGNTGAHELNIREAIELALKNDPDIRANDLTVRELEILRDKAAAAVEYVPTGGMVSEVTHAIASQYQQAEIGLQAAKKLQESQKELTAKNVIDAYTAAIKNKNTLDLAILNLQKMQKLMAVNQVSRELGLVSAYNWEVLENGLSKAEAGVKAAEANYLSSIVSLNELLGTSKDSRFQLVSRPVLNHVPKNPLETELSRATSDSVLVLKAKSELELEKFNQNLIIMEGGSVKSSEQSSIDLNQAQVSYDQSRRDARTGVEGLYYGIDALEKQVESLELAYKQAERELNDAQLRYRLGIIPLVSSSGASDLITAQVGYEKAKADIESLRADLVNTKANFYYLTGRSIYESADWSTGSGSSIDLETINNKPQTGKRISFTVGAPTYRNGDDVITLDTPAYIKSGRTYLPVRALGESLGAQVSWDEGNRTVTLKRGEDQAQMVIGDYNIRINGSYTTMEVVPEIVGGRTMLPARYVAEAFGALISWVEKSQEVVMFQ